jgi:hypothetical protein
MGVCDCPSCYPPPKTELSATIHTLIAEIVDRAVSDVEDGIAELRDEISTLRADLEGQIERNESLIYESIDQHEREYDHDTI